MRKKITLGTGVVLILFAVLLTFLISYTLVGKQYQEKLDALVKTQSDFAKLAQADVLIRENFCGDIDDNAVENGLIKGYLSALDDPYSKYLTPEEYEQWKESSTGVGVGVGVRLTYNAETRETVVYSVIDGSSAQTEGVLPHDIIYKIDGVFAEDLGYYEVVKALGDKNVTQIQITVQREVAARKLEMTFTLTPASLRVPSVSYEMLKDQVGYIHFFTFDEKTPEEFNTAALALMAKGARGLVLDVRNNNGGDFEAACKVLDRLLPEGVIARTTNHLGEKSEIRSDSAFLDLPLSVLVNHNTAGAAELFAATLRDFDKASITGETTYGKGLAQTVMEMDDGSALILSTLTFAPPHSDSFHGVGLKPDIESELNGTNLYLIPRNEDQQIIDAVPSMFE